MSRWSMRPAGLMLPLCCCAIVMLTGCPTPVGKVGPPDPKCQGKSAGTPCDLVEPQDCKTGLCDVYEQCVAATDYSKNGAACGRRNRECSNDTCDDGECLAADYDEGTVCDDQDGKECTEGRCDGKGTCLPQNVGAEPPTACDDKDGNECTSGVCDGEGTCAPQSVPARVPCPTDDPDPGSDNPCTRPECDGEGTCVRQNADPGTPCPTGDPEPDNDCTTPQCFVRQGVGKCLAIPVSEGDPCPNNDPDGGNVCTEPKCDANGDCQAVAVKEGTNCENDGFPCSTEICKEGRCLPPECTTLLNRECPDDPSGICIPTTRAGTGEPPCLCASGTSAEALFMGNSDGDSVISFAEPATVDGNFAPDTNRPSVAPSDIVVTAYGTLIVCSSEANSLAFFDDAMSSTGSLTPDRIVQGKATLLDSPVALAISTHGDQVFAANSNGDILVFDASGTTLHGNVPPSGVIISSAIQDPIGLYFDDDLDVLYVAGDSKVVVIPNAGNANGDVEVGRSIESDVFGSLSDVFVDPYDTLYVVDGASIHMFRNAWTLNGNVDPDSTLTVPGAEALTAIAVDRNGTGYIGAANAIYSYDNIAALSGALEPERTIQGAKTQLDGLTGLAVVD